MSNENPKATAVASSIRAGVEALIVAKAGKAMNRANTPVTKAVNGICGKTSRVRSRHNDHAVAVVPANAPTNMQAIAPKKCLNSGKPCLDNGSEGCFVRFGS